MLVLVLVLVLVLMLVNDDNDDDDDDVDNDDSAALAALFNNVLSLEFFFSLFSAADLELFSSIPFLAL